MNCPWETDLWITSQHTFTPEVQHSLTPPDKAIFHDVTIREAEELAGQALTVEQKLEMAQALTAVGLNRLEVANIFPSFNYEEGLQATRLLIRSDLPAKIYACCSVEPEFIDMCVEAGVAGVTFALFASDLFLYEVIGSTRQQALEKARAAVAYAKNKGLEVGYMMTDGTRAAAEYLCQVAQAVAAEGADVVAIGDSLGVATPHAMGYLVRLLKDAVSVPIKVHCHNDYGLALANAVAGWAAGACIFDTALNGAGPRAGNVPFEQMVMALEALYGVRTGMRLNQIASASDTVRRLMAVDAADCWPIVGRYVHSEEFMEWKLALMERSRLKIGTPFLPEAVGRQLEVILGIRCDTAAVKVRLDWAGIDVPDVHLEAVAKEIKQIAQDTRKTVTDEQLREIAARVSSG